MAKEKFLNTKLQISAIALACLFPLDEVHAHDQPGAHGDKIADRCYGLALDWLESLDEEQRAKAVWPFDDRAEAERLFAETERRRKWHYLNSIPSVYQRQEGLAFRDMNAEQRVLGHKFVRCGLSSQGYQKVANIMIGEDVGWETLPDQGIKDSLSMGTIGGSGAYWLALFGEPSEDEPWQWQLEGHHLTVNFTIVGDDVEVSPAFFGSRPTVILDGLYAGWHLLGYEKDRAHRLLTTLDDDQLAMAVLADKVVENIFTDPNRLEVFESYDGLPASELNPGQKELLRDIIKEYVENYEHEIAHERLAEIESEGLDKIHFAWIGPTHDRRYPIYFRIHGPSVLIEFVNAVNHGGDEGGVPLDEDGNVIPGDHNIPDSNHIHSVYRRPGSDFGDDLLREHYLNSPDHDN